MMKNFTIWAMVIIVAFSQNLFAQTTTTILDFETAARSTPFQYFGSTLEPDSTAVVDNPFKTGINTSNKVSNFKKPPASQTWAGAFSKALPVRINVTTGGQICVKVLFKQAGGNVTLKLEEPSAGGSNWERTITNTGAVDTWQEFCFDSSLPSNVGPNQAALGHTYGKLVLFMDFGDVATTERNYFFDDVVVKTAAATSKQVTFQVNMKGAPQPVNSVFINGSFNNWVPKRLTKNAADSVWKGTFSIATGNHSYQFTLDSPATRKEVFNGFETCTKNDAVRREIYRTLTVSRDSTYPAVCYNSCYNCGEAVKVTVNLGTSAITVAPTGMFIAGGGNFGNPGDFPMAGTGAVKSITFERPKNFESFYTFTNGNCPDYSCKENIAGQACANAANFNDRKMGPITKDTVINTCFASCSTTTNCSAADSINVTFRVNMRRYTATFTQVYVSGTFNNWAATGNPMTRPATGDSIWRTTIRVAKGIEYEFKYQLDGWAADERFTTAQAACTKETGGFRNRVVTPTKDSVLTDFCFGACVNCVKVNTNDVTFSTNLFNLYPSVSDAFFTLEMNKDIAGQARMQIVNAVGQTVQSQVLANNTTQTISTQNLPNGLYFVSLKVDNVMQTRKLIVQH